MIGAMSSMSRRRFWFFFFIILALAAGVRCYKLGSLPGSLTQSEVALWVEANILMTGGWNLPSPLSDSLAPWLVALSFQLFGRSEWALRLPSAMIGITTVVAGGWLARTLFRDPRGRDHRTPQVLQLVTMLVLSLSPWAIFASRAALQVDLHFWQLIVCVIITLLAYPLRSYWWKGGLVLIPLAIYGILSHISMPWQSSAWWVELQEKQAVTAQPTMSNPTVIDQLLTHPTFRLIPALSEKFADTFDARLLFVTGDRQLLQGTGAHGLFLMPFLPFLLLGLYQLAKTHRVHLLGLIIWICLAALPAAFTQHSPNSFYFLLALVPFSLLISVGLTVATNKLRHWWPVVGFPAVLLLTFAIFFSFSQFWHYYLTFYPSQSKKAWSSGFKEATTLYADNVDRVDEFYWEFTDQDFTLWLKAYVDPQIENTATFSKLRPGHFRGFEHTAPEVTKVMVAATPDKLSELHAQSQTVITNVTPLGNDNLVLAEVKRK